VTLGLAEQIANAPPFAVKLMKRSLRRAYDAQGFRVSIDAHFDTHQLVHTSQEGAASGTELIQTIKQHVAGE
jgi:enoyl-CoA hydratase